MFGKSIPNFIHNFGQYINARHLPSDRKEISFKNKREKKIFIPKFPPPPPKKNHKYPEKFKFLVKTTFQELESMNIYGTTLISLIYEKR